MKKIIFISILFIALTAGYSYAIINCHGDSGDTANEMTGGQGVMDDRQESTSRDGITHSHQSPKRTPQSIRSRTIIQLKTLCRIHPKKAS